MNFASYLRLFRRWFWLIGLAVLVSGGAAYYVAYSQPPLYQAIAKIEVGNIRKLANPSTGQLDDIASLANTYFERIKNRPVLESIIKRAGLTINPDVLALAFTTIMRPGTPFFDITVTDKNPQTAANLANAIADEFVAQTAQRVEDQKKQIASIETQVDELTKSIASEQRDLSTIETCLKQPTCSDPILVDQQTKLTTLIATQQGTLAQFQAQLISLQSEGDINELSISEPAIPPTKAISGSAIRDTILAGGIGGALSIGIIALLEQLNTTIRSSSEIPALLRLPVLGMIPLYGRRKTYRKRLVTWLKPSSKAAEAFRVLRGNLMYIEKDRLKSNPQCYIITSSRSAEGKSITAANLAVAFSTIGQRVILVDADIRQPTQHSIFNLTNKQGLSDILSYAPSDDDESKRILMGDPTLDDSFFSSHRNADENVLLAIHSPATSLFYSIPDTLPIQKTEIPRLQVITSGTSKRNPADLVGSLKMKELVDHLIAKEGFDIVIIDTPAVLEVSDSTALAGAVEAPVILVVEEDRTTRNDAAIAVQRFSVLSLPVLGVILNRAKNAVGAEYTGGQGNRPGTLSLNRGSDDTQQMPAVEG